MDFTRSVSKEGNQLFTEEGHFNQYQSSAWPNIKKLLGHANPILRAHCSSTVPFGSGLFSGTDLMEKFKKLIDEYNKGLDVEAFFAKLVTFVKELSVEEQRGVSKQLVPHSCTTRGAV